jgi:hypothetical protein
LRVVRIGNFACSRSAARGTTPPNPTALAIERAAGARAGRASTTAGSSGGCRRRSRAASVGDGLLGGTAAAPAFDGNDLVVQGPQAHAERRPLIEVVRDGDGAAGPGRVPDGDVLVEGRRPHDRGLIDLLVFPDGVCASVAREGTLLRPACGYPYICLHDIVLNQWVLTPAVDRETAEPTGDTERTAVANGPVILLVQVGRW